MVHLTTTFIGLATLIARLSNAIPVPDSAVGGEVAVSAPNGVIESDTAELSSQLASESMSTAYYASTTAMAMDSMTTDMSMDTSTMMDDSSSTMMDDSSSTMMYDTSTMMYDSSSMMMDSSTMMDDSSSVVYSTSTSMYEAATTTAMYDSSAPPMYTSTSADLSTSTMSYGSGSTSWGSGYDSCVQQCVASYGAPMASYTPPPSTASSYGSSGSGGTTHTVIVAPTQGVLRYVPFAVNASVGDTVKFIWGANVHTVTKSSQLEICNKTSDAPFASGSQNQSFVFTQVVNDTQPTFFYCGTPTHCQKGMFGIINPPSALTASTSVTSMMPSMITNSSTMAAMASYTNNLTMGNNVASNWGGSINMDQMPSWSNQYVAQNVMYTRTFLAANPDVITSDGSVNLGATSAPFSVPQDLSAAILASSSTSNSAAAPSTSAASSTSASSAATTTSSKTSGARSLASSSAVVASVAVAAAFFAL